MAQNLEEERLTLALQMDAQEKKPEHLFVEDIAQEFTSFLRRKGLWGGLALFQYALEEGGKRSFSLRFTGLVWASGVVLDVIANDYALGFLSLHGPSIEERAEELGILQDYTFPGEEASLEGIMVVDARTGEYGSRVRVQTWDTLKVSAPLSEITLSALSLLDEEGTLWLSLDRNYQAQEKEAFLRRKVARPMGEWVYRGTVIPL